MNTRNTRIFSLLSRLKKIHPVLMILVLIGLLRIAQFGIVGLPMTALASLESSNPQVSSAVYLERIGATPNALALSGATAENTSSVLAWMDTQQPRLQAIESQLRSVVDAEAELRDMKSNAAAGLDRTGYSDAITTSRGAVITLRAAADGSLESLKGDCDEFLAEQFGTEFLERLTQIRSNAHRTTPASFHVLNLLEADWARLAFSLKKERRDRALTSEESLLLQSVRTNPAVTAAQARLQVNGSQIEDVFAGA